MIKLEGKKYIYIKKISEKALFTKQNKWNESEISQPKLG
jgi:hypothetical protein